MSSKRKSKVSFALAKLVVYLVTCTIQDAKHGTKVKKAKLVEPSKPKQSNGYRPKYPVYKYYHNTHTPVQKFHPPSLLATQKANLPVLTTPQRVCVNLPYVLSSNGVDFVY